jgi:O-antigen ligase
VKITLETKDDWVALSFLSVFAVLPFIDILAPIAIGVCLVLALIFKPKHQLFKNLAKQPLLLLLIGYFLLTVLSLSYTITIDKTVEKIGKNSAFLLIPVAFVLVNPNSDLIKKAKHVFVIACALFCVFSLTKLGYNYIVRAHESHWYNFIQESMYHKYMPEDAMYLNTALVFLLFGTLQKYIKLAIAFLFFIVIVLFGVRLGLFLFGCIVAAYVLKNIKLFLNYKTVIVGVLAIVALTSLLSINKFAQDKFYDTLQKVGLHVGDDVSEFGKKYHDISLRAKVWKVASNVIKEKPMLGYGGGAEKKALNVAYETLGYQDVKGFHAHNQLLSSAVQYGILGALMVLAISCLLCFKTIKARNIPYMILTVLIIVSMSTESYFELQQGIFYFCVFVSMMSIGFKNNELIT